MIEFTLSVFLVIQSLVTSLPLLVFMFDLSSFHALRPPTFAGRMALLRKTNLASYFKRCLLRIKFI
jgi:hypothetical protein